MSVYEQTVDTVGFRRGWKRPSLIMLLLSIVVNAVTFVLMYMEPTTVAPIAVLLAVTVVLWNATLWTWRLAAAGKPRRRCGLVPLAIANLLVYATIIEASCLGGYAHSLPHGSKTFLHHWAWTWTPLSAAAVACFVVYCVMRSASRKRPAAPLMQPTGDSVAEGEAVASGSGLLAVDASVTEGPVDPPDPRLETQAAD